VNYRPIENQFICDEKNIQVNAIFRSVQHYNSMFTQNITGLPIENGFPVVKDRLDFSKRR